jgi:hypothetical protein
LQHERLFRAALPELPSSYRSAVESLQPALDKFREFKRHSSAMSLLADAHSGLSGLLGDPQRSQAGEKMKRIAQGLLVLISAMLFAVQNARSQTGKIMTRTARSISPASLRKPSLPDTRQSHHALALTTTNFHRTTLPPVCRRPYVTAPLLFPCLVFMSLSLVCFIKARMFSTPPRLSLAWVPLPAGQKEVSRELF